MKKILLIAIVAGAGLSLASCKKARTCECTFTDKIDNTTETISYTITTTKKKMKDACDGYAVETSYDKVSCAVK